MFLICNKNVTHVVFNDVNFITIFNYKAYVFSYFFKVLFNINKSIFLLSFKTISKVSFFILKVLVFA